MSRTALEQIVENSASVGKTYDFDDTHNARRPAEYWFQDSQEGRVLFLVLYGQACRWSKCLGCNLPSQMTRSHVPYDQLMDQIDYVFDEMLSSDEANGINKIILSNNGSVLDEQTFSTTALLYFVAKMNRHMPNVQALSLESRCEYVDEAELEVLSRALAEGSRKAVLELAVGFEAFDDQIRNDVFHKGMTLEMFEKTVVMSARHDFHIKAYFMLKPVPDMSEQEALADIVSGMEYLDTMARKHGVQINMHLNPTYVASGTPLEVAFREGRFSPPKLDTLRQAALASKHKKISLFLGLSDEGLAIEGGTFAGADDEELLERLEEFNRTGDHGLLEPEPA